MSGFHELQQRYYWDPYGFVVDILGAIPDPKQAEVLRDIVLRTPDGKPLYRKFSIRSGHGVGKALAHGEPVLTPTGWRPIEDLRIRDEVIAGDGTPTKIIGVFPQGERDLYRVTTDDGSHLDVDGDHLWFTTSRSERKHGKPGRIRTTLEIAASLKFSNGPQEGLNHGIPAVGPVQHPAADLPIEPYLLGCWLGDGSADGRITGESSIFETLASAGARLGDGWEDPRSKAIVRAPLGIRRGLRELGLFGCRAHEKRIPASYLHGSIEQRTALLQGLLDTDGTVGRVNNAVTFDSTSELLADGVAELTRSLGGIVRRAGRQGSYGGKACRWVYRLTLSLPRGVDLFRLPSKKTRYRPHWGSRNCNRTRRRFIAKVEPIGRGQATCIAVDHPSRLFVTRDHIVTHNTTLLAWLVVWFLWTRFPQKTAITAPTSSQLFDALWPEVGKWIKRLKKPLQDLLDITGDRIRFKPAPEESFVSAKTSRPETPEAMAGVHSDNVMLLFDEASGIPEAVFEAAAGSMSGDEAITFLTGNPVRGSGTFHATHMLLPGWKTYHISCLDSPRVSKEYIEEMKLKYGEESNQYRVRVLGEFPLADDDTVIAMDLIRAAVTRDVQEIGKVPEVWGLDVARSGSNSTVLLKRRGLIVDNDIQDWQGKNTMQTCGLVKQQFDLLPEWRRPVEILIDSIGVGGGVADRLIELGLPARAINVGESPSLKQNFVNLRAELWWMMREWFEQKNCKIPKHDKLIKELAAVRLKDPTSGGKTQIESKEDMKRRNEPSPDFADALMLTFASTAGIAMYGWGHARNKPLKRNIKGVV